MFTMVVAIATVEIYTIPSGLSFLNWLDYFLYLPQAMYILLFIWLVVSSGMLVWDVRQILCQMRTAAAREDVLYIGEDDADDSRLKTHNYDLHLRD